MSYIKKEMSILEIIMNYPETKDFFVSKGFTMVSNNQELEKFGKIKLEMALKMKKINVDVFVETLNDILLEEKESVDINLTDKNKLEESNSDDLKLLGLLPCPVKNPLLEALEEFKKEKKLKINSELKAASSGVQWLKDDIQKAEDASNIADMFISAGFDLFFEKTLMGKFKNKDIFSDLTGINKYNKDFDNNDISLKDPENEYSMLGVVPAIFLVNKEELGDREFPKTWEDILKPEFENSISLPISDFDLFNAILINIHKRFGDEGVEKLGKSLLRNMHPSQMVKSNKLKDNIPTITIMPYFFSKMVASGGPMVAQWPEDGAIISPIFMLTKKEKSEEIEELSKFLSSKKVGEILSHQGLFPSINPEVDNNLDGKKFMWIGWDYIKQNDIGEILKHSEKVFFGKK